ncbi:MAG: hypothetical protein JSV66_00065 [Trueperaceae bacterium]|nr:MAG: hypothetical protein JSV66_00065 [Trueperaceae bacterium]
MPPAKTGPTTLSRNFASECTIVEGRRAHWAAFQAIDDANGAIGASDVPEYCAVIACVTEAHEAAGYQVELLLFEFTFVSPTTLDQTATMVANYETGVGMGSS